MKILSALGTAILYCCGWAGLFLACRVGMWFLGKPGWWSVPASLAIGFILAASGRARASLKKAEEERRALASPDPRVSARFRQAWKRGQPYRSARIFPPAPELPWYLCLKMSSSLAGHLLELGDAVVADTGDFGDEFTWRKGPVAAWLDFPEGTPDDESWRAFANVLGALPRFRPPSGVVIRVDAVRLLNNTHATVHDDAIAIRRKLELLQKAGRRRLPFYLVVDNLDRLYGLRSVISRLPADRLAVPMGRMRGGQKECAEFVTGCLDECLNAFGEPAPEAGPAAMQAPDEIRRLETPLIALCAQLCKNPESGPYVRGLFLAASAPGGEGVPPLLSRLPTFQAVDETLPVQPWFLRGLLREEIPADADSSRYAVGSPLRLAYPAGAAGLLAGSVVLCLLLTCSFVESRGVLLSARGRAGAPSSAENLEPYLELATLTRLRNNGWRLPRFGMTEPEELEGVLRQRYTDSYFDLKTAPSIEHVQDAAIEAAESDDPVAIGNALLLLAVTRDGIGRNINPDPAGERHTRFLHTLVETLGLADAGDMKQLDTYFAWAGRQEWMPETHAALKDFEKYIADNAGGGDFSWLPAWINRLPGLRGLDTTRVWDAAAERGSPDSVIGPAWTAEGYGLAKSLLIAIASGSGGDGEWEGKIAGALARYRTGSMEQWRKAAAVLWDDFQSRVPDAKIRELYRDAVRGDDPAARFLRLADHHLLPMFKGIDGKSSPELHWLRLHEELLPALKESPVKQQGIGRLAERLAITFRELGSDDGLDQLSQQLRSGPGAGEGPAADAVEKWQNALRQAGLSGENPDHNLESVRSQFQSWNNPGQINFSGTHAALQDAAAPAGILHEYFRQTSGSAAWDGLSPLASLDYLRYLAARQAALKLDLIWREQIYQPAQLVAGGEAERLARLTASGGALERFLTGTASGFWHWDGQKLANTKWGRIEFMFDREFLDFCALTLREGKASDLEKIDMPFRMEAVHVDRDARERPTAVEITFESGGKKHTVSFQNYRLKDVFSWYCDDEVSATVAVVFPSLTASIRYAGKNQVRGFIESLADGEVVLSRDLFPDSRAALGRMGISRILLRAELENTEALLRHAARPSVGIPASIITKCAAPEPKTAPSSAYGPFVSGKR